MRCATADRSLLQALHLHKSPLPRGGAALEYGVSTELGCLGGRGRNHAFVRLRIGCCCERSICISRCCLGVELPSSPESARN